MKRLNPWQMIGRALLSFSVSLAPFADAAEPNPKAKVEKEGVSDKPLFSSEPAQVIVLHPGLPPAQVVQQKTEVISPDGTSQTYTYETIQFFTTTPEQYASAIDFMNSQLRQAKVNKLSYSVGQVMPDTAGGEALLNFFIDDIDEEFRDQIFAVPFAPEQVKAQPWAKRLANFLVAKGDQFGRALVKNKLSQKIIQSLEPRARRAARWLSPREPWYRSGFSLVRWGLNGTSAFLSFMKSTGDSFASVITGYGVMGSASAALQFYIKQFNDKWVNWRDPLTRYFTRRAIEITEHDLARQVTEQEAFRIANRIMNNSRNVKWVLTEKGFILLPHMIMILAFAHNLLGNTVWGASLSFAASLAFSILAQMNWDNGNAELKELDYMRSDDPEDRMMADFMESLRANLISIVSVGGTVATMSNNITLKTIGFATLTSFGYVGWRWRVGVGEKYAHWKDCQTALKGVSYQFNLEETTPLPWLKYEFTDPVNYSVKGI